MDGTSMAAPHVAGAIALVLSRAMKSGGNLPTATQIASALRQKTSNYTSRWDRGQGYGIIDVAKLLAAF
jgi:subtilisin family serine protease